MPSQVDRTPRQYKAEAVDALVQEAAEDNEAAEEEVAKLGEETVTELKPHPALRAELQA